MNSGYRFQGLLSAVLLGVCGFTFLTARAQTNYGIAWSSVDGGGGTSTNAQFKLAGTIGQPDAGTLSGGGFTIAGGLWGSVAVVQVPGAPLLTIRLHGTNAVAVTWPSSSSGWQLQESGSIDSPGWINSGASVNDDGTNNVAVVSPSGDRRFFRLHKTE